MASPNGVQSQTAGPNTGRGAAAKAYLKARDHVKGLDDGKIEFLFNPNKLSVSRSVQWEVNQESKGGDVPQVEFKSGQGRTLKMELFVDKYEEKGDARDFVRKLELLTEVDPRNKTGKSDQGEPPKVTFGWGKVWFDAVVKSLDVSYTLFHEDGRPARAKVNITLQEVPPEKSGQNPTSGGEQGRTSHLVLPGETLDLIAYQELGAARHWQHIAEINGLDNPLALRPGQSLVITPPRS